MYNQELKDKFLSTITSNSSLGGIKSLFNRSEEYENKFNTDLYNMSKEQLLETLESISGVRMASQRNVIGYVRRYADWLSNSMGIETSRAAWEINKLGDSRLKETMISSPESLQSLLDVFLDKTEFATKHCVYRCAWWLMFIGIMPEDINNVQKKDIDLNNKIIYFNNRQYKIYDEAIGAFKMCINSKSFYVTHPKYKMPTLIDRVGDGLLDSVRSVVTARVAYREIKKVVSNSKSTVQFKLTLDSTWISGEFYRMKIAEDSGFNVDFSGLVDCTYKKVDSTDAIREAQVRKELANRYMRDYLSWKEVFFS